MKNSLKSNYIFVASVKMTQEFQKIMINFWYKKGASFFPDFSFTAIDTKMGIPDFTNFFFELPFFQRQNLSLEFSIF